MEMLEEVLPLIQRGTLPRKKQDDSLATVMPKRRPEDGVIDWNRSSRDLYNWVRALTEPYPGAFSFVNGQKLWIWKAQIETHAMPDNGCAVGEVRINPEGWLVVATADGWIRLVTIQPQYGPKTSGLAAAANFLAPGTVLGEPVGAIQ